MSVMQSDLVRPVPVPVPPSLPPPSARGRAFANSLTVVLVTAPVVALAVAIPLLWGAAVTWFAIVLAVVLYLVTGHGIAIGFHRLFTHSSFKAARPLKLVLAMAGSLAMEGSLGGWVAIHRRHHMFSDRPGDPHSPHRFGSSPLSQLRGLVWAHVGWAFASNDTTTERYAPDMLKDHDLVVISRLFPLFAVFSMALPFALGFMVYGTLLGAFVVFLWAGLVRMMLLHHVTWSINSLCHMFGRRPNQSSDMSTNVAVLSWLSFGESWHNYHHAHPASARHGAYPHQMDSAAILIHLFERCGWAYKVRWPHLAMR